MLKNIPACISPELISTLMKMGHGDEIVLADADFPADSCNANVIRADGVSLGNLLEAILEFFPLDTFVQVPVAIMAPVENDAPEPENWEEYRKIIRKFNNGFIDFEPMERYVFYKRTKRAFAAVITGEPDGNLVLRKGVVNLE